MNNFLKIPPTVKLSIAREKLFSQIGQTKKRFANEEKKSSLEFSELWKLYFFRKNLIPNIKRLFTKFGKIYPRENFTK